ncbi:beta-phosphoglucomutase [Listeria costaricensis]|uniref:beta-phosphoglucomutase n=1 Tax=Listeria costaricensis TaxID=2026604 RepID=UPI000C074E1D|nr:beta-phosphoglucomutase [Listeria costaricensis]
MKKGLVFDLDGVITDTAKFHYLAWKALAAELDITIDEKFNETLKGISRMDSLDRILAFGGKEDIYTQEEKEALAAKKNTHYVELLSELSPSDLLPGVHDFLEAARVKGIPCALASASKNAPMILDKLDVANYFAHVVDPATLKKGKPDPEIFLKAAASINLAPEETIGFEDAAAGIQGIKEAGMYAVGLETTEKLTGADIVVKSFNELDLDELLTH